MAETFFNVRNYQVVTLRVDPTEVRGEGSAARPVLHLPFKVQILPTRGDQGNVNYVLLRLAGRLESPAMGEFAEFELPPLLEESRADPYFRDLPVKVVFDRARIRQFEDARSEAKAHFAVSFSALMWFAKDQKFEKTYSNSPLQVIVPRSHWVDDVLSRWGLSSVKLVEIRFPTSQIGDTFRMAYARIEGAEKLFANGLYKQVLTELRVGFEALADGLGFEKRIKDCLEHLLSDLQGERKEKARDAALALYRFLHLGPHLDSGSPPPSEEPRVLRRDARFALVTTLAFFEYITPER